MTERIQSFNSPFFDLMSFLLHMEVYDVSAAFCDVCQDNFSAVFEFDKFDCLGDFLLISGFYFLGFVLIDSVADFLLKLLLICSVFLSHVSKLIGAFLMAEVSLGEGIGIEVHTASH